MARGTFGRLERGGERRMRLRKRRNAAGGASRAVLPIRATSLLTGDVDGALANLESCLGALDTIASLGRFRPRSLKPAPRACGKLLSTKRPSNGGRWTDCLGRFVAAVWAVEDISDAFHEDLDAALDASPSHSGVLALRDGLPRIE